jgi:hypothetical protein
MNDEKVHDFSFKTSACRVVISSLFSHFFINCCFLSVVSEFHQLLATNNQQIVKYATGLDISGQLIIQLAISKQ